MMIVKQCTDKYKHDYLFTLKGKQYRTHSIVRLTPRGKQHLHALKDEAILTEQFVNWNNALCWKYVFRSINFSIGITDISTDVPPEELIEEVIMEASEGYSSICSFGKYSPFYREHCIKHSMKDWEIPKVMAGWVLFVLAFFALEIFNDTLFKVYLRALAWIFFAAYRKRCIDETAWYEYPNDEKIEKMKYCVLYENKTIKECGIDE
jgi:hypothetical protein